MTTSALSCVTREIVFTAAVGATIAGPPSVGDTYSILFGVDATLPVTASRVD